MTTQQLQSFIEEMEERANNFDKKVLTYSQSELHTTATYWQGVVAEARFVIDRIKHLMEK